MAVFIPIDVVKCTFPLFLQHYLIHFDLKVKVDELPRSYSENNMPFKKIPLSHLRMKFNCELWFLDLQELLK